MKTKTKIITGGVLLAVLIGGYFGAKEYRMAKFRKLTSSYESIDLVKLESDKVVEIDAPVAGFTLRKKDDLWEVVQKPGIKLDQEEIKSLTWSLSNMRADRVIDEEPKDLSAYGLDKPKTRIIVKSEDGKTAEYIGGNLAPTKRSYYAMVQGDPKVYAVPSYPGERLYLTLSDVRIKALPTFEFEDVRHAIFRDGNTRIEIEAKEDQDELVSSFSQYVITSPYKVRRGVDPERFGGALQALKDLKIRDFIDDAPASLAPYGLDKPRHTVFVQGKSSSLHLHLGNRAERPDRIYAKLDSGPEVFTVDDFRGAVLGRPFDFIDKFALIINIDKVDSFTVRAGGKTYKGEITREKTTVTEKDKDGKETSREETKDTYFFNGRRAEEKSFKNFYQTCIGLMADAENPSPAAKPAASELTIEYKFNAPAGAAATVSFAPYNRDFYALYREGVTEFLVSRMQTAKILEAAEKMEFTAP
jgi:hypothetical protein